MTVQLGMEWISIKKKLHTHLNKFSAVIKEFLSVFDHFVRLAFKGLNHNPSQNIWHKLKKYSKTGQDVKNVISNFVCFLTAIVNVSLLKGRLGTSLRLHHIWHFSNISWFRKILSLKSFSNSFGNLYTKFVMLDIKYRLNCGDSNLSKIIKKCQHIMTRIASIEHFSRALTPGPPLNLLRDSQCPL